uniref:Uncharacterized protein n=1 Tax=Oryza nivara TaxID=4536 RepID=A0A0E0J8X3_ORYNI
MKIVTVLDFAVSQNPSRRVAVTRLTEQWATSPGPTPANRDQTSPSHLIHIHGIATLPTYQGPTCQPDILALAKPPPGNRRLHRPPTQSWTELSRHGDDAAGAQRPAPAAGGGGAGGGRGAGLLRQHGPQAPFQAAAERPVGRRGGWGGGRRRRRPAGASEAPRPRGQTPEVGAGRWGCERGGVCGDAILQRAQLHRQATPHDWYRVYQSGKTQ